MTRPRQELASPTPGTGPAPVAGRGGLALPAVFALALFASAFLLFLVQPMIARMALPLLGGTPAVWNTCMVFFQALLLAGYAYAHAAPAWLGGRRQALAHLALLPLPLLVLPIGVGGWEPPATDNPTPWLLGLLLASVGLPFFVLATSAPLLQRWFAGLGHAASRDPYFLYAASNLGSIAALVSYPLLIEPALSLTEQARCWQIGYVVLAALTAGCALLAARLPDTGAGPQPDGAASARLREGPAPTLGRRLRWAALALVPCSVMLGVTSHLTTDVATIPLLWVLPLAVYLLTVMLAFTRLPRRLQIIPFVLLPPVVLLLALVQWFHIVLEVREAVQLHLVGLFLVGMVCHLELARTRPAPRYLTGFYLWMSLGGVLGGAFNALVAPLLLDRVVEYPLMAAVALLLVPRPRLAADTPAPAGPARRRPRRRAPAASPPGQPGRWRGVAGSLVLPGCGLVAGALMLLAAFAPEHWPVLFRERNYFGVLRVRHKPEYNINQLYYGTTSHGEQCLDPARRREPIGYFHPDGPVGQFFRAFRGERAPRRVAVVGLGAGALAGYAEPAQDWTYYEIDPAVERVAWDTRYFTYLSDARERGVKLRVVLGDARLRLREEPGRFDLIVLDAFNSDAIPVHLLTREALRVYLDHLDRGGVLVCHISSRYLRLAPVLAGLARDAGLTGLVADDTSESPPWKLSSEWALLVRRPADLGELAADRRWQPLPAEDGGRVWTDDYADVIRAVVWTRAAAAGVRRPVR